MPDLTYPDRIDRLARGALSQMGDYFSFDIKPSGDIAMLEDLEDRAFGTAAKIAYFNTIRNELKIIASGERKPADGLRHLDDIARAWVSKGVELRDRDKKGASMALALSDRWQNWAVGGAYAKERIEFQGHFGLPD